MADTMKIQVISVDVENKGKYNVAEVTFKNRSFQDKVESKKHMDFVNKDVFEALKNSKKGDEFTITREKDKDGKYWQWVGITAGDAPAASSGAVGKATGTSPVPRSTYETPEERAKKQVYIVRQSSISAAIDTLKTDKKAPSVEEVIAVARQYEAYVFGLNDNKALEKGEKLPPAPEDLEDDIPY